MNTHTNARRAFVSSIVALVLCLTMLMGTTFAWFTDTASVNVNKIQAGTLDIELYKLEHESWRDFLGDTSKDKYVRITDVEEPIFDYDKWEPGYLKIVNFQLVNEGNLAAKVKYTFAAKNDIGALADAIDVYHTMFTVDCFDREVLNAPMTYKVGTLAELLNGEKTISPFESTLLPDGDADTFSIIFKMREDAGNEYQSEEVGAFDIRILATQDTVESDSFNNQYDADAN